MNKIDLIGRITHNVELRKTSSGKSVVQFDIAVKRTFKNADGEYDTDFFQIDTFNHTADYVANYCNKGDLVAISGRLQNANYEKDGKMVYKNSIIGEEIMLCSSKKTASEQPEVEETEDNFSGFTSKVEVTDDDLPF